MDIVDYILGARSFESSKRVEEIGKIPGGGINSAKNKCYRNLGLEI